MGGGEKMQREIYLCSATGAIDNPGSPLSVRGNGEKRKGKGLGGTSSCFAVLMYIHLWLLFYVLGTLTMTRQRTMPFYLWLSKHRGIQD